MQLGSGGYFSATRHPWPCLLFLLPLLVAYEAGVLWLGGSKPEALRNGADTWLRWGLESFGFTQFYCAPALILAIFLVWSWLRFFDRPDGSMRLCVGMAVESGLFALGLWAFSRQLGPLLEQLGIPMSLGIRSQDAGRLIMYVGAGIYEETLFRLFLLGVVAYLLRLLGTGLLLATVLATLVSALVFAGAHHVGPYGEAFESYTFLFRALAGLYFALLYQLRGFAVAVGTHACYDVLVGVLMV